MRIRNSIAVAGAALVAWSAPVQAQCAAGYTQDACQKTVDLFNFLAPQISTALSGGAATIGQGGVLGGFPHWTLGVRASAVNGSFPTMDNVAFSTTGAKASSYAAEDQFVPMATIDGSIGIYQGFPLGITRVGGIDAILTATYIPSAPDGGDITVTLPGGSTKWGGGVRLGLLQESILIPGVAFSYVQRGLPTLSVAGSSTVNSSAGSAPVGTQHASAVASHSMKRTNMYIGGSLNFIIGKLVAEYGQVSGGSLPAAMNAFGSSATASRSYFSVGLRTGF